MPTLDRIYNADVVIDGFHHLTHRGRTFTVSDFITGLTAGANYDILLRSPGGAHVTIAVAGEQATTVSLYEGVTFSGSGTDITVFNRNRFYAVGGSPDAGDVSKVQVSHTPTGLGSLTRRLFITYLPGGQGGNAAGAQTTEFPEWVINGEDYLVRITNEGTTGDVGYEISWYEPIPPDRPQG